MKIRTNIFSPNRNPVLGYRLDPGEPGMLRRAKASESFIEVSAQERRNINRLKTQAVREGRQVLFARIKYTYGIDGSYSSLRAGETTVVSKKAEKQNPVIKENPDKEEELLENPLIKNAEDEELEENLTVRDKEEIDQEAVELEQEKNRLKNQLTQIINDQEIEDSAENEAAENTTARSEQKIKQEIEAVEKEINRLKLEKFSRELEEQQNITGRALNENLDMSSSITGLINGKGGFSAKDSYVSMNKDKVNNYINQFV